MIIMDVKLDNICAFRNFHVNFSYPKKLVNSSIEDECLSTCPTFRYKKVNIIIGANATGKTSLGLVLMAIFNSINKKNISIVEEKISDKNREAYFQLETVSTDSKKNQNLTRIFVKYRPVNNDNDINELKAEISLTSTKINSRDTYEKCKRRLDELPLEFTDNIEEQLSTCDSMGWYFTYPADTFSIKDKGNRKYSDYYPLILKNILMSFDRSIIDVVKAGLDVPNTFVIKFNDQSLVMQNGEVIEKNILSSGTKSAIDIAEMVSNIFEHKNGFYYCDEKFSYVQNDLEQAILSIMIQALGENEQLFFTTHNVELLSMNLPKHSFLFLKKEMNDIDEPIKAFDASSYLKKDSQSLKNAVDNDLFSTNPNLNLIYSLENIGKIRE